MITGIGSLPFTDVDEAIDLIFSTCTEIPFWPQLPKRSKVENMYVPFVDGIPFFKVADDGSVYFDEEKNEELEEFLELVDKEEIGFFSISEDLIPGFYRLLERLGEIEFNVRSIKTQITGPISMGLGIRDGRGVPVIYDEFLFDLVKKTINMKAKWMVYELKKKFPRKDVIIFFDEPYLVAYGSIYFSFPKENIVQALSEVVVGIEAKKGVHCCGNTDWSIVLRTDMDIVNYDAFNYLESIFLYAEDLKHFLEKDGLISPGVVPSTEEIKRTKTENMRRILENFFKEMMKLSNQSALGKMIITPSCGLGSLEVEDAIKAMGMLKEIPAIVFEVFDKAESSW